MTIKQSIGIIGMGNMASAIISKAVEANIISKENLFVREINPKRQEEIKAFIGMPSDHSLEEVCNCDIILIGVKPQNLKDLLQEMKSHISEKNLLLSIVTGFTTSSINNELDNKARIIRIMPNTPVMVGKGMCALCKGEKASQDDLSLAMEIFSSLGKVLVTDEEKMDLIAALSGSGPAYFFYIVECLIKAGIEVGLSPDEAKMLAIETFLGSAKMLEKQEDPLSLRDQVTSPGGSTAEGLKELMKASLEKTFQRTLQAAIDKNRELGS